jgi:hypothetical protein
MHVFFVDWWAVMLPKLYDHAVLTDVCRPALSIGIAAPTDLHMGACISTYTRIYQPKIVNPGWISQSQARRNPWNLRQSNNCSYRPRLYRLHPEHTSITTTTLLTPRIIMLGIPSNIISTVISLQDASNTTNYARHYSSSIILYSTIFLIFY